MIATERFDSGQPVNVASEVGNILASHDIHGTVYSEKEEDGFWLAWKPDDWPHVESALTMFFLDSMNKLRCGDVFAASVCDWLVYMEKSNLKYDC